VPNRIEEVTARPNDHLPSPGRVDDQEPPAPEELGRVWLEQATESERSLGFADTIPDLEAALKASGEFPELNALNSDEADDDEITAEYVRRYRISATG